MKDAGLRLFISYRRDDCQSEAIAIYYGLQNQLDAEVFLDVDSIRPGIAFDEEIVAEIDRADVVLILIGDDWLSLTGEDGRPRIADPEDYVHREVELGLARNIPVVPVLVEGARLPLAAELPEGIRDLARRQAITVRNDSMTQDIRDLAAQIKRLGARDAAPAPAPAPAPAATLLSARDDDEVGRVLLSATTRLAAKDAEMAKLDRRVVERDLAEALAAELPNSEMERSWPVPNWDPQPGRFDIVVSGDDGRPRLAIETKLKSSNDIYECLWDLLKLVALNTLDHLEGVYIVAGTSARNWRKPIKTAELFRDGSHEVRDLIGAVGDWWETYILGDSAGRPQYGPEQVNVEVVGATRLQLRRDEWEIRAIKATASTRWVRFADGKPPGISTEVVEEPTQGPAKDTVIVAGRRAYPEYRHLSAYVCQAGRFPRQHLDATGIKRIGFYRDRAIQPELALILENRERVVFDPAHAQELRESGRPEDATVARLIEETLGGRTANPRTEGAEYQVFLLSGPEDERTVRVRPVLHEGRSGWTQGHRYAAAEELQRVTTTAEIGGASPDVETDDGSPRAKLDFATARAFIESVPRGRWTSYGEVAAAAGAPRGAMAVGEWLRKTGESIPGVWRVLRTNGEVSEGWGPANPDLPKTPTDVQALLQDEGVVLQNGRAHVGQIWRAADWPHSRA